jgi:hypothetical protein
VLAREGMAYFMVSRAHPNIGRSIDPRSDFDDDHTHHYDLLVPLPRFIRVTPPTLLLGGHVAVSTRYMRAGAVCSYRYPLSQAFSKTCTPAENCTSSQPIRAGGVRRCNRQHSFLPFSRPASLPRTCPRWAGEWPV